MPSAPRPGRRSAFSSLRQAGGLSGYPNRAESEHDWIENSHASTVLSYAHGVAEAMGSPDAGKLVLTILVENPIPILIPCHRVITNKSGIGSYIGGGDRKRWLLDLEQSPAELL